LKNILKLIKDCNEAIEIYYSKHYIISMEGLREFESKLKQLIHHLNEKYPLYCEELYNAINEFQNNKNLNMGRIFCVLSLIEKEEQEYEEYVDNNRITEIKNISATNFDMTKLLHFCKELNYAYYKKHYLTIPLLLRAIIDHVPPIFNKKNFDEVSTGHGSKSFRDSMVHLNNSLRKIADATIHTQIRERESMPNETQINFKADLDVLLGEICRIIK